MKKAILAFSWILMAVSFLLFYLFLIIVMQVVGWADSTIVTDVVQGAYYFAFMGFAIFLIAIILNIIASSSK